MDLRGGLFGKNRRRTGGEHLREHLAAYCGAPVAVHGELDFTEKVAVLVYHCPAPVPHFLYVTHGISRTSSSLPVAGTQTELTVRVPATADPGTPPTWPAERLRALAALSPIEPGHYVNLHKPMCEGAQLTGFLFAADPELPINDAPSGRVAFTTAVGVTADELDAALSWDPAKFVDKLMDSDPLGLTSPQRQSMLLDESFHTHLTTQRATEGSRISAVSSSYFDVDPSGRIDMTTHAAAHLLRAARWRFTYGRDFAVMSDDAWARFIPDPSAAHSTVDYHPAVPANRRRRIIAEPPHLTVTLTEKACHEILAVLDTAPGTYRLTTAPLVFQVIDPTR